MEYERRQENVLKTKVIDQTAKEDFAEFWQEEIGMLRSIPLTYTREKLSTPYDRTFETYEIVYSTHDDTKVHAYFSAPVHRAEEKLPCVAYFHGGGECKDIYPEIVATGVCCFAIDVRSQGGTTPDMAVYSLEDSYSGLMTKGVTDKAEFYMKNIYLDAVRALDVIADMPEVDREKIVTFGASQGGALSIVASALSGHSKMCYTCVPSYNCLWQRIEAGSGIFETTKQFLWRRPYLTDKVFDTVTYFDVNNMVSLLTVPTQVCLDLQDPVCLPEFVYSVFTHIAGEKQIKMYPFKRHEIAKTYYVDVLKEFSALA